MFEVRAVEPIDSYSYAPLCGAGMAVVGVAKRLQSGRLDGYVGYVIVARIAVLIVAAALR